MRAIPPLRHRHFCPGIANLSPANHVQQVENSCTRRLCFLGGQRARNHTEHVCVAAYPRFVQQESPSLACKRSVKYNRNRSNMLLIRMRSYSRCAAQAIVRATPGPALQSSTRHIYSRESSTVPPRCVPPPPYRLSTRVAAGAEIAEAVKVASSGGRRAPDHAGGTGVHTSRCATRPVRK